MHKTITLPLRALLLGASLCVAVASVHAELAPKEQKKEFDALFKKWQAIFWDCKTPAYPGPMDFDNDLGTNLIKMKEYDDCMEAATDALQARTSAQRLVAPSLWSKLTNKQQSALENLLKRANEKLEQDADEQIQKNEATVKALLSSYYELRYSVPTYREPVTENQAKLTAIRAKSRSHWLRECVTRAESHISKSAEIEALADAIKAERQRLDAARAKLETAGSATSEPEKVQWNEAVRQYRSQLDRYNVGIRQTNYSAKDMGRHCPVLFKADPEVDQLCKSGNYPQYCAYRQSQRQ